MIMRGSHRITAEAAILSRSSYIRLQMETDSLPMQPTWMALEFLSRASNSS